MRIGVHLFATRRAGRSVAEVLDDTVRLAVLAEELGFDTLWLAEHHDTDWNRCTDPLTLLAHLGARTQRIRLGAAVVNLVLHHPVEIAERALLVDAVSGGRLDLGLGRGFAPADYARFGVRPVRAQAVFEEHWQRLHQELAADSDGRTIPIWVATTGSPATLDLAAQAGHGLLLTAAGQRLGDLLAQTRARQIPRVCLTRAVTLGPSRQAAARRARPGVRRYIDALSRLQPHAPAPDREEVLDTFCVLGDVPECLRQIQDLHRIGITGLTAVFGIGGAPREQVEQDMREFAAQACRDR